MTSRSTCAETSLPPFDEAALNVFVDTPKGSRNKYKFDPKLGCYRLKSVLPEGHYFPFDFGFIPSTLGEDGDPLDVLIVAEESADVGILVPSRLVGVLEAVQARRGKPAERNDRLIAVAEASLVHDGVRDLSDLPRELLDQIERFFVSYNAAQGKRLKFERRRGRRHAKALVKRGEAQARAKATRAARS
jgi:inorganic pyrophosphatase